MEHGLILSGFGGQGLLFAGQIVAQAAILEGRNVSWLPSYGPEMRGGSAACTVIVSDRPIGSPVLDQAEILIALNPPALSKYAGLVAPRGLIVVNDSLIEAEVERADAEVIRVPASVLARTIGDERFISIVGLGAALARRPIVTQVALRQALEQVGKGGRAVTEANLRAFQLGVDAAARAARAVQARR
ncbi:MAG TPA: 2-oxoacid:acceptor oxidoreductase family protein [Candidatus Limnocylindrales bacterium]|nr:2-oxoacid:acceptor oxidoreductase family protein [Candidatus Limnocylindrales bacterium]